MSICASGVCKNSLAITYVEIGLSLKSGEVVFFYLGFFDGELVEGLFEGFYHLVGAGEVEEGFGVIGNILNNHFGVNPSCEAWPVGGFGRGVGDGVDSFDVEFFLSFAKNVFINKV